MRRTPINIERLREVLDYDKDTGIFTWKVQLSSMGVVGAKAGYRGDEGYLRIRIDKKQYRANRLAWAYVYGEDGDFLIDHINMDVTDDRICNLRKATYAQNNANAKPARNNTSGVKGVFWNTRDRRWVAQIRVNGKAKIVGRYLTKEEAIEAMRNYSKSVYGEFYHDPLIGEK